MTDHRAVRAVNEPQYHPVEGCPFVRGHILREHVLDEQNFQKLWNIFLQDWSELNTQTLQQSVNPAFPF
jgi:hypothetical protein